MVVRRERAKEGRSEGGRYVMRERGKVGGKE